MPLQIALGLQKRSPIGPMLDHKLQQMREAGLLDKWILDGIASAGKLAGDIGRETRIPQALSLDDLQGIFILYGFLILMCVIVWGFELISLLMKRNKL